MKIKEGVPGEDYKFYNPADTSEILYSVISKISLWKYNKRKKKEEKKDWWYIKNKDDLIINISLLFNKFIPKSKKEEGENKDKYLELVIKELKEVKTKTDLFSAISFRLNNNINELKKSGYEVEKFRAKLLWRMIIGLGGVHPEETSMTLHYIYGIPYIPGSAVKGITRHYSVHLFAEKYAEENSQDYENVLKNFSKALEEGESINIKISDINFIDLIKIFGTQKQKGEVIFFDAYPVEDINFSIDIMNPHYPEYYTGSEPPADWQDPRPIKFLTVENTEFEFILASRNEELLKRAVYLLKDALLSYGIGAKTSLGYGILEVL